MAGTPGRQRLKNNRQKTAGTGKRRRAPETSLFIKDLTYPVSGDIFNITRCNVMGRCWRSRGKWGATLRCLSRRGAPHSFPISEPRLEERRAYRDPQTVLRQTSLMSHGTCPRSKSPCSSAARARSVRAGRPRGEQRGSTGATVRCSFPSVDWVYAFARPRFFRGRTLRIAVPRRSRRSAMPEAGNLAKSVKKTPAAATFCLKKRRNGDILYNHRKPPVG